jgi:hypothetical protein
MGNLHRKELCKCNVQLVLISFAIGLHEAEIKMPKFFTNIQLPVTPWSRVLLESLRVSQLVKKFPAYYGILRFITAFTRAHHLSLF